MSLKGAGYIVGGIGASDAQGAGQVGRPAARRMRQGRAGGRRPDQGRRGRLFLRRRRAGRPRPAVHGRLHEPEVPARGQHRCRRFVLSGRGRPRAGSHRRRPLQHRADHARRPAAQRGHGDRHRAARRQSRRSPKCSSNFLTVRPRRTCTRCARSATCMNTAPPASSSPGSRSPPRITRSTTRTPCCAMW